MSVTFRKEGWMQSERVGADWRSRQLLRQSCSDKLNLCSILHYLPELSHLLSFLSLSFHSSIRVTSLFLISFCSLPLCLIAVSWTPLLSFAVRRLLPWTVPHKRSSNSHPVTLSFHLSSASHSINRNPFSPLSHVIFSFYPWLSLSVPRSQSACGKRKKGILAPP